MCLLFRRVGGHNQGMQQGHGKEEVGVNANSEPFAPGAFVVVSLAAPREKYWGVLLTLNVAGVSLRGIVLDSFDDFASQVRGGEPANPAALFFPMHRVERIEVDARNGELESLCEGFEAKSGKSARLIFAEEARR